MHAHAQTTKSIAVPSGLADELADLVGAELAAWRTLLGFPPAVTAITRLAEEMLDLRIPELRRFAMSASRDELAGRDVADAADLLHELDRNKDLLRAAFVRMNELCGDRETCARYVESLGRARRELAEARNRVAEKHVGYVCVLARRFVGRLSLDDLVQEGVQGLLYAIERFDARRGVKLTTYASYWIKHYVRSAVAELGRPVRLPVHVLTMHRRLERARSAIAITGRETTAAATANLSQDRADTIDAAAAIRAAPLHAPHGVADGLALEEILAAPDAGADDELLVRERRSALVAALGVLSDIERDIVRQRFGLDDASATTLQTIAEERSLSRERIRQLEIRALAKLRRELRRFDEA